MYAPQIGTLRYMIPSYPQHMRLMMIPAAAAVLLLTACSAGAPDSTPSPTAVQQPLIAAVQACKVSATAPGVALGDEYTSLTLDGQGSSDVEGVPLDDLYCILDALDMPEVTRELLDSTNALDGRQTASWDGYEAAWSFHPDSGLNVTVQTD